MPSTPEATRALRAAGVRFAPGKAANAGGVAVTARAGWAAFVTSTTTVAVAAW